MDRSSFLKTSLAGLFAMTSLNDLKKFGDALNASEHKMPVLFVGHGSPMNAIEDNEFSRTWKKLGEELPRPAAVLCISAHWETNGTFVTAMPKPKTIHDFGGFPQALFNVQYPAPGSPEIAQITKDLVKKSAVETTMEWGLDHGCWSVVKNIYPNADVPVLQLSLDFNKNAQWHFELAKELAELRKKGILILGSGNMVHNLSILNWNKPEEKYEWAEQLNAEFKSHILSGDFKPLINYSSFGKPASLAIPTPEHYLPMMYALGLKTENEPVELFNDRTLMGSISMTSFKIG